MKFVAQSADTTGVGFVNRLELEHPSKRLFHSGFVCGGVAIGDVDGDGRPDLYLVSGPGANRLYRQVSDLKFEEIGGPADGSNVVGGGQAWGAGAAMVDIDNDRDLDIYVCNYDSPNQLYINQGKGTFQEAGSDYGLDVVDSCLLPTFCDYDRDGDLDLYLLTNRYYRKGGRPRKPPFAMRNGRPYVLPEFE